MKITLFMMFVCAFQLVASTSKAQDAMIELPSNSVTVETIFSEIEKQTDYLVVYSNREVDVKNTVNLSKKRAKVSEIIQKLLENSELKYEYTNNYIVFSKKAEGIQVAQQAALTVKGKVVDETGEPIIGANVIEKGTTNGVITDVEGKFSLRVSKDATLEVSYIGYSTQHIIVQAGIDYSIVLKESALDLDDVVVIGYGVLKKKLSTGATLQIKGDDLVKLNTVSPISAMQSNSPGVQITQNSGLPGSGYKINIRGLGTMGNSSPLVIIDGIIGGDFDSLNASDIESIDVLKDAASAAIYGARAANGVILVTTKSGKEGKTTVSYDGYVGIQNPGKALEVLDAYEYMDYLNEATDNSGLPRLDFAAGIPLYEELQNGTWRGTNWAKEYENKNAFTQNHAFNLTSGNSKSLFSMGLTYTTQEAVYGSPSPMKYERYTGRINSDNVIYRHNDRDIIKIGERLIFTAVNNKNSSMNIGGRIGNNIRSMNFMMPVMSVYDKNGNYSMPIPLASTEGNPIASSYYKNSNRTNGNRALNGNLYLEISPVKNLLLKTSFNLFIKDSFYRSYIPVYKVSMTDYNTEARVNQSRSDYLSFQWENTISYNLQIKNAHSLNLVLGQSIEKSGLGDQMSGTNINPVYDGFDYAYLSNCKNTVIGKTMLSGIPNDRSQLASFFGRVNYNNGPLKIQHIG